VVYELELQSLFRQGLDGELVAKLFGLLLGGEHEIAFEQPAAFGHAILLGSLLVHLVKIDDEALLYAKDGVGGFVRVALDVESAVAVERKEVRC